MLIKNEKVIIGLEIHITLNTKEKVFNTNKNNLGFDTTSPLTNIDSWELGYLGDLPFLNEEVIDSAITICSIFDCDISKIITFDRKIYSYFDLPKGFQITQEKNPIGKNGFLPVLMKGNTFKKIPISRIQIEEDTAKSHYVEGNKVYLNFERSGNPLIEVVTEPVFDNIDELISFAKQLRSTVIYFGVSDAKMERGQFRIDLNYSFQFNNGDYKTPRFEIKNLNSFKNLKIAFNQELEKHRMNFLNNNCFDLLSSQTLGYNEITQKTFVQRKKTSYSYIQEYNIPPVYINRSYVGKDLLILPWKLIEDFIPYSSNADNLIENLIFLNFVNFLIKEKINYSDYLKQIPNFVLNYLNPSMREASENSNNIGIFNLENNLNNVWKVFKFWMEGRISKDNLKAIIIEILSINDKKTSFELEKHFNFNSKKIIEYSEIEKLTEAIINDPKNEKKIWKASSNEQRFYGYMFGKLKETLGFEFDISPEMVKNVSKKYYKKTPN
ncbi:MAG TPA: hypothetical protein VN854_00685 [Mycoplasmatales bacterium]|jgi:aspartyl-tRNA(Asn)/glutamyl-tRNA(Gln) amidotransferase subunit B|nr:hypothetical protein [Mycoplasmatales bacterium]